MKTVKEILTEARDLLDKKGWTQFTLARTASGMEVGPYDPDAICFCAAGAMQAVSYSHAEENSGHYYLALTLLEKAAGCTQVGYWNNAPGQTKEGVLAGFDKAIALCGEEK